MNGPAGGGKLFGQLFYRKATFRFSNTDGRPNPNRFTNTKRLVRIASSGRSAATYVPPSTPASGRP
jgi:nucleoid-associated protein YgaU